MKSTPFTDPNKQRIFEGDFLDLGNGIVGLVKWSDRQGWVIAVEGEVDRPLCDYADNPVIGDTTTTPELMEVRK